ncbi:hypothetical protein HPULCUR_011772 [Helicostylum pulchrum]|uniref:Methyltransferase domain-containing protein n=1 Tax=Helicostylum pulchrum TaxID=562976 RepID=A0ABP9YH34_9FUNG
MNHSLQPITTPPGSVKSPPQTPNSSRRTSLAGDSKSHINKALYKSASTIDVFHAHEAQTKLRSGRSYSVTTADQFPEKLNTTDNMQTKINGRTYQTVNKKYCLPIDEEEQDRLTNTHYVLKHCFGDNFSAPVHDLLSRSVSVARDSIISNNSSDSQQCLDNSPISVSPSAVSSCSSSIRTNWNNQGTPARVLDVACGSGVWVLDMATAYPDSQFYGIDFACIYPNTIKPANTTFHHGDLLDPEGFPYPDEYFDYIHMRLFVLSEINRVLKPGGYVELRDIDPTIKNPGPTGSELFSDFTAHMLKLHTVDVTWTQSMCEVLSKQAELTDIHRQEVSVGFGYQGPLANSIDCSISDGLRSHEQFFMEAYNLSSEACTAKINAMIEESAVYHSYFNYYLAWGRKPLVYDQLHRSHQETLTDLPNRTEPFLRSALKSSCQSEAELSVLSENAFDIVHFANGFIE